MSPSSSSESEHGVWPPPIQAAKTFAADRWLLSSTSLGIACAWRPMPLIAWWPAITISIQLIYGDYKLWIEDLNASWGHIPNALMHANLAVLPWAASTIAVIVFFLWWIWLVYNRNINLFEYETGYVIINDCWRYRLDSSHGLLVKSWSFQKKYAVVFRLMPDRTKRLHQMNLLAFMMVRTRFLGGLENEKAALEVANYLSGATGIPVTRED